MQSLGGRPRCGPARSQLPEGEGQELGLTRASSWQVLALARQQNKRVKVVGGGHSPSDIACTDGFMIHMGKMNRVLQVLRDLGSPPLLARSLSLHPSPRKRLSFCHQA